MLKIKQHFDISGGHALNLVVPQKSESSTKVLGKNMQSIIVSEVSTRRWASARILSSVRKGWKAEWRHAPHAVFKDVETELVG